MYRKNILLFSSELFVAVDPIYWQDSLLKLWTMFDKTDVFKNNDEITNKFFSSAIPYIQDVEIIEKILKDCIGLYKVDPNISIFFTAEFYQKKFVGKVIDNIKMDIESIVKALDNKGNLYYKIAILGNLYKILSDDQKDKIREKIKDIEIPKTIYPNIWKIFFLFAKGHSDIENKIKSALIENNYLWMSGYKNGVYSYGIGLIKLHSLRRGMDATSNYSWSKKDSKQIFTKLKSEYEKIKDVDFDLSFFKSLYYEMYHFLKDETENLKDLPEYDLLYPKIEQKYLECRGFSSFSADLSSDDDNTFSNAVHEFSEELISTKNCKNKQLESLIYRTIYRTDKTSIWCIEYIVMWLGYEEIKPLFEDHKDLLILVLKKYKDYKGIEYNLPKIHQRLIKIAEYLNSVDSKDEIVKHWLEEKKKSHFNNIRFGIDI
jgi:hypothetical protein